MFVEVGTTDLAWIFLYLDTGGHDYWLYKETHTRVVGRGSGCLTRFAYESSFWIWSRALVSSYTPPWVWCMYTCEVEVWTGTSEPLLRSFHEWVIILKTRSTKIFFQFTEGVIITQCQIWNIRWMFKCCPSKPCFCPCGLTWRSRAWSFFRVSTCALELILVPCNFMPQARVLLDRKHSSHNVSCWRRSFESPLLWCVCMMSFNWLHLLLWFARFHLPSLFLQERQLYHFRTAPKVLCALFPGFIWRHRQHPQNSPGTEFFQLQLSIFCIHALLLLTLRVTILHCYTFVSQNQVLN